MIEIRTFAGEPGELSRFTVGVWREAYEGRMHVALWSEELFRREFFPEDDACRDYLIVAYDGTRLVGSHPSRPLRVRLHGQEIPATWGSFLSVAADYRRRGVALRLQQEWARRHREHGAVLNLGYQYVRSAAALGPKFWLHQPKGISIIRKLGMWMRAFDHVAVARFSLYPVEGWGSRILSLVQKAPRPPRSDEGVRSYHRDDLEACHSLICQAGELADLAYLWEPHALERQLCFGTLSHTVVLEREGRVSGLVNYSLLEVLGRFPLLVAVIELIAFGTLSAADRHRLLAAALCRMEDDGAKAAIMLRTSPYGWRAMLATGFLPTPPDEYYIAAQFQDDLRLNRVRRLQVLWR
jgi:GNAT superfamily N-acetyltransferase